VGSINNGYSRGVTAITILKAKHTEKNIIAIARHSSPIFKLWKFELFICSVDRVLIADLRKYIVCKVENSYFGMHGA